MSLFAAALFSACVTLAHGSPPAQPPLGIEYRGRLVELVNQERRKAGLDPLKGEPALMAAAQAHALDMSRRGYFSHQTPEGQRFGWWAEKTGYAGFSTGQTLAMGCRTPEQVVILWMNSPSHRTAILRTDANQAGAGLAGSRNIAVLNLGASAGVQVVIENEAALAEGPAQVFVGPRGRFKKMRFREDGGEWTEWRPPTHDLTWTFANRSGVRTLTVEAEGEFGAVHRAEDAVFLLPSR
jgi:hypothetical protein